MIDQVSIQKRIDELEKEIERVDTSQTREQAADLFFEKSRLLNEKIGSKPKETALALYNAALRYQITRNTAKIVSLIKFARNNYLEESHPRLKKLLDRLKQQFDIQEEQLIESSEPDEAAPHLEARPPILREVLKEINEKVLETAVSEESKRITRQEAAVSYFKLFKMLLPLLDSKQEDVNEEEPRQLARDLGNRCLLRCLVEHDLELSRLLFDLAEQNSIHLHSQYTKKMQRMEEVVKLFHQGRKVVQWLPKADLDSDSTIDEQILTIIKEGYRLNIEEKVEFEVLAIHRLDLLSGLQRVPVEQVIGSDIARLTPLSIILSIFDYFPSDLIALSYRPAGLELEEDGLMVVPTGNIDRLQVVYLVDTMEV
ncbi:MAG: hypothetical protein ACFFD4_34780 [Candidatus Odinarchaeota archaeon]